MYPFPSDFDNMWFVNRSLEFITFGANSIGFIFDGDVNLTVESSIEHRMRVDDEHSVVQKIPLSETQLMQLLSHSVLKATGDTHGTLTLVFDNGHVLNVFDDNTDYESYSFCRGPQRIII